MTSWKWGHTVTMTSVLLVEYLAFILIVLNFPDNSVFGETYDRALISSRYVILTATVNTILKKSIVCILNSVALKHCKY